MSSVTTRTRSKRINPDKTGPSAQPSSSAGQPPAKTSPSPAKYPPSPAKVPSTATTKSAKRPRLTPKQATPLQYVYKVSPCPLIYSSSPSTNETKPPPPSSSTAGKRGRPSKKNKKESIFDYCSDEEDPIPLLKKPKIENKKLNSPQSKKKKQMVKPAKGKKEAAMKASSVTESVPVIQSSSPAGVKRRGRPPKSSPVTDGPSKSPAVTGGSSGKKNTNVQPNKPKGQVTKPVKVKQPKPKLVKTQPPRTSERRYGLRTRSSGVQSNETTDDGPVQSTDGDIHHIEPTDGMKLPMLIQSWTRRMWSIMMMMMNKLLTQLYLVERILIQINLFNEKVKAFDFEIKNLFSDNKKPFSCEVHIKHLSDVIILPVELN